MFDLPLVHFSLAIRESINSITLLRRYHDSGRM
jgi:hypothetical protein